LKIQDPARFDRVRDVGAFIGLCARRDQSGENDPQLRISKRGDAYLRRLFVSAAQYILGPFAPPSALREYGLALAAGGTPRAKKRAAVAVAETGRSAFDSVEEQERLSNLPQPQRRKSEDF
jgi:transposase